MPFDPIPEISAALEGRYRIASEVGEGGMATVYLARDLRHDRNVALKVLRPQLAAVVGAERFLAEIRTTANLQHPNILPLFDSGEVAGFLYYVMPYVEGESLRSRLDAERQLPIDEAVRIAQGVAEGLDYAHRQGVIHRDIKPANILLVDGKPVIADFGIALAVRAGGGDRITETGLSVGTPSYMSPEQATGDTAIGPATDVWALACVLFEMLVGEPPYAGGTPQAILGRILTAPPTRAADGRPTVPEHIDAALSKALERVPADRFRSALAFANALQDSGFRYGTGPAEGRDSAPLAVASGRLAWLLAILLGAGFVWQLIADVPETPAVPLRTNVLIPVGTGPWLGTWRGVDLSADGRSLSYYSHESAPGGVSGQTWIRDLTAGEPAPIPGTRTVGGHFLSPDGAWVVFDDANVLRKAPVGGGAPEMIARLPSGLLGGDWSDDGRLVYATTDGISIVSADGGNPRGLTSTQGTVLHTEPAFLPDLSGVLFTERGHPESPSPRLVVLGFDGERSELLEGHSGIPTANGLLVFGRDPDQLWAVRMSGDWRNLESDPIPVLQGVAGSINDDRRKWFALSETGTLAFVPVSRHSRVEVVWADRHGEVEVVLDTDHPQIPRGIEALDAARLSPDENRIVFHGRAPGGDPELSLFSYDLTRGVLTPVHVGANAVWPIWAPDGERILFNRFDGSEHDLYWARVDNASPPVPFSVSDREQHHPQWFTEDGTSVIVQFREVVDAPSPDLWLLPVSGGEGRPLVAESRSQLHAGLSPDGRWLLYGSTESGQNEVYVTEFSEPHTRTTVSTERAYSPVWSPQGDEIYYRRWGDNAMMVVPVLQSDTIFRSGTPRVLFEGRFHTGSIWFRSFDVTSDGQRFLMTRTPEGSVTPLSVEIIQNWTAELERRVAFQGR